MVLLTYSRGRGRGGEDARRGGRSFSMPRGRGRGRSMTWKRTPPPPVASNGATSATPQGAIALARALPPRGPCAAPRTGGNRVWVNAAVRGSSKGSSGETPHPPTLAPVVPPNPAIGAPVSMTSKSGNRVWTKAGSGRASNAVGSTPPASVPADPASYSRGGASAAPRSGRGHHLVWTNAAGRGRAGGAEGGPIRTHSRAGAPPFPSSRKSSSTGSTTLRTKWPSTAAAAVSRSETHARAGKFAGASAAASSSFPPAPSELNVASKAPTAVRPKPEAASSSPTKSVARYSGLPAGRNFKAAAAAAAAAPAPAPAPAPSGQCFTPALPVARYSGSASLKRKATTAAPMHTGRGPQTKYARAGQQVARYSGAGRGGAPRSKIPPSGRGGAASRFTFVGRDMRAWRGRGGTRTAGRGASAGGYFSWPLGSRRGIPAWGGAWGYNLGGRGWGRLHSRYPAWAPAMVRFGAHPAPRWAAGRWAHPWAGGDGRGRGRIAYSSAAGLSRQPPRRKQVRYKNRTLIRVRSLLPQQQPAVSRAAILAGAVARRASLGSGVRLARSGAALPTKFVRSGKHGMAIRRVDSSALAARRAAAGTAASSPAAKRLNMSFVNSGAPATTAGAAVAGGGASKSFPRALGGKAAAAGPVAKRGVSMPASSALVATRKAALLDKAAARARSVAAKRAAAVVAGARVKRSRQQLVRNMTLYRGKGQVAVAGGGIGGTGKESAAVAAKKKSKKAQKKTVEPCLFFCKFGKCSKSDEECRFVHDKSKVAVCRAFLRKGGCDKGNECLLTHAVQAEKMPVCIYFEKGMCFTPNCPYLHVKVSRNAAVCPSFLKGYCPDGTACRLKHELPDPRKRTRDVSTGGDQADGGDDAGITATGTTKKKRIISASATGARGEEERSAASASMSTSGGGGDGVPSEGRPGKSSLLPPPRAASAEAAESERGAGGAVVVAAPGGGGGGGGGGAATTTQGAPPSSPQNGGGSIFGEVKRGERKPPVIGQAQRRQDEEEDSEDDEDDDLKPAFLRKRKKR